jgi:hypothetical protein
MRCAWRVALILVTACGTRGAPSTAAADAASSEGGEQPTDAGSMDAASMDTGSMEPSDASFADRPDAPSEPGCIACNGTCDAGRCTIILGAGQWAPFRVAVDSANAYWTNSEGPSGQGVLGAVVKAPLGGGTPVTLVDQQPSAYGIAVAQGNVYWSVQASGGLDGGSILSIGVDGGTVSTIATGQGFTSELAVDSSYVYWASGYIARAPLTGGPVTTLVSAVSPQRMALDATSVYFTTNSGITGKVERVPKSGGMPQTLAFEETSEQGVAVDQANVYWSNSSGDVMKEGVDGAAPMPLAFLQTNSFAVAVDATSIYWPGSNAMGSGGVFKTSLDGGAVTTITNGWGYPLGFALDATSVYFTTYDGYVVRVTPK